MRHAVAVVALLLAAAVAQADSPFVVYKTSAGFDDVMEALKGAIAEKGLFLNNVMHMGTMLARTGKDLNLGVSPFLKAESVELCSAVLSHKMTAQNPARVVNCPFIVSVYVRRDEPHVTYIVHRRVTLGDDTPVMREVEAMLESLGKAAAEAW